MCPGQGVRMGRDAQSRKSEPEPGAAARSRGLEPVRVGRACMR